MSRLICVLLLLCLIPMTVLAQDTYYGTVVCEESVAVLAPYGGRVSGVAVAKGDAVSAGDLICTLESTGVCAPVSGTVTAVFASEGDNTESIKPREGFVVIEPECRLTLSASTAKAYNAAGNRFIRIGEPVLLAAVKDTDRAGSGRVVSLTADDGKKGSYSVEIAEGDFAVGETVAVYRGSVSQTNKIGQGTVAQTAPIAVSGDGSVLKMHVREGETVQRGALLFETVQGTLDGFSACDKQIVSGVDGIVSSDVPADGTSADKNSTLISLYPLDRLQIAISVTEAELSSVPVGTKVSAQFSWNNRIYEGTVSGISFLPESTENTTYPTYRVMIDFEADRDVRIGMTAAVQIRN